MNHAARGTLSVLIGAVTAWIALDSLRWLIATAVRFATGNW